MAARPPSELIAIQRDLEASRAEIAAAMADLERAAKSVVTTDHWKRVAERSYERRPALWLAAAFGLGYWIGSKVFAPKPGRLEIALADED